jgi:hypothetical protein
MEAGAEIHAHHHTFGHRWIDLALALSALVLSITSIVIAIENDRAMQRLVTANSWPYLQLSHGNALASAPELHELHFDVTNVGIGPAMLEKLVVTYEGQAVRDAYDLLARCCGPESAWGNLELDINTVSARVLPARETINFLKVPQQAPNLELWKRLDAGRFKIGMVVCYSSVFGEHWITTLGDVKARSVKSCEALAGAPYLAGRATHQ